MKGIVHLGSLEVDQDHRCVPGKRDMGGSPHIAHKHTTVAPRGLTVRGSKAFRWSPQSIPKDRYKFHRAGQHQRGELCDRWYRINSAAGFSIQETSKPSGRPADDEY